MPATEPAAAARRLRELIESEADSKKGEPPGQEIRQWGKAISTDGKGRPDLFEFDLGNGDRLFTHVLWAN